MLWVEDLPWIGERSRIVLNIYMKCNRFILCFLIIVMVLGNTDNIESFADMAYVGDVDGDGDITPKDVTVLRRYLAGGWNVSVSAEDADVDGDGDITPKDVTVLRRFLAGGWGVELPVKESAPEFNYIEAIDRPYTAEILVDFNQTEARTMLDKINEYRASLNDEDVEPLVIDYDLEKVAMQRAAEIAVSFGSTRPDGETAQQTLIEYGFNVTSRYNNYSEMMFMGDKDEADLEAAFNYFISTTKHRVSLTGYYYSVGIGHVKIDESDFWVVELFSRSKNLEYEDPVDGRYFFPVNIPESLVLSITPEYIYGWTSVAVGASVTAPIYLPKVRFLGSDMEEMTLSPLFFESGDEYVRAVDGVIIGLAKGIGTIRGEILGKTLSVNIEVK